MAEFVLRQDFQPYPSGAFDAERSRLLAALTVAEVSVVYYACTPSWRIPRRPLRTDLMLYVVVGAGTVEIDERRLEMGPGDLVYGRAGARLGATSSSLDTLHLIIINLRPTVAGGMPLAEALGLPDLVPLGPGHAVEKMLFEACREQALHPPGWERGTEAVAIRVLLEVVRRDPRLGAPVGGGRDTGALERLLPALEAMRQDLASPLPVGELAARCSLSEAQFRRIFHRALGQSPVQHLRRLRIDEACRLLETTRLPLHEIARQVGYAEPAFFQRTFAELVGEPPGHWRDRRRLGGGD